MAVRRTPGQPHPTNQLPIYFDILIDEPVVDFPVGPNVPGIEIGGTATGLRYVVEGAKETYRLTVLEVEGDGTIEVSVPEGLCADLFGNVNYASTAEDAVVHYDGTRPKCAVESARAGVVNNDTMKLALVFSEPVFGLRDDAVSILENATVARVSGADGDPRYEFEVTPVRDGIVAFQVPEDAVTDAVGNGNEASEIFSLIVDSTGPAVRLTSFATPAESNARYVRIHATFSEPVQGFEAGDIAVSSGTLQNFSARDDGRTFIFDVRPNKAPVTLYIPAGVATDVIGNPNRPSEVFHRDYDAERPEAFITVHSEGRFRGDSVVVEVQFSEPVFGFVEETLDVSGGGAFLLGGGDGEASYRFAVQPSGRGTVRLSIDSGAVRDAAGNGNRGARASFTLPPRPPAETVLESGAGAPPLIAP